MDAQQRRAGEGPVQVDLEQRFDRTETQRPDVEAFERSRCDGTFEVGPAVVGGHSAGEQQRDRLGHPAQRDTNALTDEPSSHWTSSTATTEPLPDGSASVSRMATPRARGSVPILRLGKQQRRLHRPPPWRRVRLQHRVDDSVEQVADPGEGESVLRLRRARDHTRNPRRTRLVDGRQPEGRLPDAGLAFEDEHTRPERRGIEELVEPPELVRPTNDVVRHRRANHAKPIRTARQFPDATDPGRSAASKLLHLAQR